MQAIYSAALATGSGEYFDFPPKQLNTPLPFEILQQPAHDFPGGTEFHAAELALEASDAGSRVVEPAGASPRQMLGALLDAGVPVQVCAIFLPNSADPRLISAVVLPWPGPATSRR